eukprot:CAMPEP_0176495434 /NCGR_PEP_ID=MMETSP0200_2-20121128/10648_1 /TAXON_ID=947934 /ORGANISM="Chaetoceros sp., Strain GSL56" /LENGTH=658 /DNA_ID=CAMNT_0017893299 /DNA_START=63 /DNA_END=2039 /DNA_ORIENTATION=+
MKRSSSSTLCWLILALLFGKSAIVAHDTTTAAAEAAADTVAAAADKEEDSSSSLLLLDNDDNKDETAILPSPDLTAEELELLAEMNLKDDDDYDDDDDDDDDAKEKEGVGRETRNTNLLYKTLYDLLDKTEKELDQWKTIQQEEIPKLMERHETLTKRYEEVQRDTIQLLDLIRQWNQNEIRSFISRIQNVIQEELHRREKLPELELQFKEKMMRRNHNNDDDGDDDDDNVNALSGALTMDHVYEIFNVPEMNRWMYKELGSDALHELNEKMKYALVEYLQECENVLGRKKVALEQDILQAKQERHQANQCVKMVDAAHQILSSLKQLDKDEKQTDALVDAKVVYGEKWTSDTYHHHHQQQQQQQQKQHELEQESNDEIGLKLGDLHVRKYFPQDWERLLPSGWEDWDISLWQKIHSLPSLDNMLPTYFWHSIPRQLTSIVESPFGKVIPAPVETVLDPNGNLGSCWKMAGRNGRVTFRLKRPVVVESITIDHYPWLSSAHNPDDFRNHVTSAPRFMRVIGYPPCDDDSVECQEQIGFDAERSIYMNSFEYKVDASRWNDGDLDEGNLPINSSQTFQLSTVNVLPEDDDDDNDDDFEDDAEEKIPTCDAVKATSCHGKFTQTIDDSQKLLAALTLTIDVNWGNPNYTCLYRVRVNERK